MQTHEAFWVEGDARRKYASSLHPFASPPRRQAHQKGVTGARSGKALHLGVAAPELRKGVAGGRRRAGDEAARACPREGAPCLVGHPANSLGRNGFNSVGFALDCLWLVLFGLSRQMV
jgi:hypothetical protein